MTSVSTDRICRAFGESRNGESVYSLLPSCTILRQCHPAGPLALSPADISNASTTAYPSGASPDEALADVHNLAHFLRTLFSIAWSSLASESSELLHNFASFARLSLAHVAESVAGTVHSTAESLRQLDEGSQRVFTLESARRARLRMIPRTRTGLGSSGAPWTPPRMPACVQSAPVKLPRQPRRISGLFNIVCYCLYVIVSIEYHIPTKAQHEYPSPVSTRE